jgi:hypothetical protein
MNKGERSYMARIEWVEDFEAEGQLAKLYERARAESPTAQVPPIYRTMSLRPDFLAGIMEAVQSTHFSDGALNRAQHEMIASYVSALNRCHY